MSDLAPEVAPVDAPLDTTPEAPAAEAWAPSQDEWNQLSTAVSYLAGLEQQRAQVYQPQQAQQPTIDPFAEDYATQIRGLVQSELQPYAEFQQSVREQEADERLNDMLHDEAAKGGEFDVELARMRMDRIAFELAPRYNGDLWAASEKAAELAAQQQRDYERSINDRAVSQYTNQLATLSGAPGEPGSTYTQGVQQRTMPDYTKGGSVANRFFGENRDS